LNIITQHNYIIYIIMLLNPCYLSYLLITNNIKINKCIHVGAHKCEELPIYINLGLSNNKPKLVSIFSNLSVRYYSSLYKID
jgi:hypothetical protein